jgi:Cu/Zn superoxide dismutase
VLLGRRQRAAQLRPVPGQRAGQRSPVAAPPTFETRNVAPARAELRDADGRVVGAATFTQVAHGVVVVAELTGLPAGTHAMHVHDVGRCEPPFTTAGGHFNPGARLHGVKNRNGYHAGDLPNFTAPATGTARVDVVSQAFTLSPGRDHAVRHRRLVDHGAQRGRRLRERPGRQRGHAHRLRCDHARDRRRAVAGHRPLPRPPSGPAGRVWSAGPTRVGTGLAPPRGPAPRAERRREGRAGPASGPGAGDETDGRRHEGPACRGGDRHRPGDPDRAGALDEQYGGGTAVGRTEDVLEARHARARAETAVRELERRDVLGDKDTDSAR